MVTASVLSLLLLAAAPDETWTTPTSTVPEYGFGLTPQEARAGWISLFDGQTTFGWSSAKVERGRLVGGETTTEFGTCEWIAAFDGPGELVIGEQRLRLPAGEWRQEEAAAGGPHRFQLGETTQLKKLLVRPLKLVNVFDGKSLDGWTKIERPGKQPAAWNVENGAIHGVGGPGALELKDRAYGDFMLQLDVRTRKPLVNGGVFFRAIPGDFMNGYEMQIFNACYEHDPGKPMRYSTGAIDDRQLARRLVSRDEQHFYLTAIAVGPHIATWVNGAQQVDWTDERPTNVNPRQGQRTKPGAIQLQAHDPESDLEFLSIRVGAIEGPEVPEEVPARVDASAPEPDDSE